MAAYLLNPNFPGYCRGHEHFDSVVLLGADLAMPPLQGWKSTHLEKHMDVRGFTCLESERLEISTNVFVFTSGHILLLTAGAGRKSRHSQELRVLRQRGSATGSWQIAGSTRARLEQGHHP